MAWNRLNMRLNSHTKGSAKSAKGGCCSRLTLTAARTGFLNKSNCSPKQRKPEGQKSFR